MERMILESSIKQIAIENENGEVLTVLGINVDDSNTVTRFANLINNLEKISESVTDDAKALQEKYGDQKLIEEDTINLDMAVDVVGFKIKCLNKCIAEINAVFGADTIRNVFKEAYELNEDFVPDESALLRFVDNIIPVMNKLFDEKFERNKNRYSAGKKGKHTKSKAELIAEFQYGNK